MGKPATSITVPTMIGTYLIKAVDYYGYYSINATLTTNEISRLDGFNAVAILTEHPTFSGTKSNLEVIDSKLQISSDSMSDWLNLASVGNLRYGFAGVSNYGEYYFFNDIDLGDVCTSRISSNIVASGIDLATTMSMWSNLASVGSLDATEASDWYATLQVRTTNDDPSGTPTWSAWQSFVIGDYSARAFEFRLLLGSYNPGVTPTVETLEISVDMPDRVYGENDLVCGVGGLTVTYAPAFMVTPSIAIAAQGLATGDYYEITNKTKYGFDIIFKDSTGTPISITFDYVAKGYGRLN